MPDSTANKFREMLLTLFETQTKEQYFNHTANQSYIGLGYATIAAANQKLMLHEWMVSMQKNQMNYWN